MSLSGKFVLLHDGRKLSYQEYGSPDGKKILFYFHGWPGSRLSGIETDEAAKKLKVRVISIDRPGFGESNYKEDRTLLDWPDDVVELANKLKIKKFSIMGVSGGGPYVAACAYKIPDRIHKAGIVVGLGIVSVKGNLDGMSFLNKISWKNYHKFPIVRTIAGINGLLGYKYFPALSLKIGFGAKEDQEMIKKKFGRRIDNSVKEAFKNGIKGPVHDLKIYTDDWGFKLKDIKTKVCLWYGAKDKNVSLNMGKHYHSQIKNSKLFIEKNGGHLFRNNKEEKIISTLVN